MVFPTTLVEWVALLSNPIVASLIIFVVFRALNRKPGPTVNLLSRVKVDLSIYDWTDFGKLIFAFVLAMAWSVQVAALDKSLSANFSPDTWPLIVARAWGLLFGSQIAYGTLMKFLGPVGAKLLGSGTVNPGDVISEALNPTADANPKPTVVLEPAQG